MRTIIISIISFFFLPYAIFAEIVQTFYGPLDIEEPVLIELIHSPAFQRLRGIHQYGCSYYNKTYCEEYTRYDHSLGVFAILRIKGASLEEQIAGLLHDVSHTVFSHVGDWLFHKENLERDYQNSIHISFLKNSGLADILKKYGISAEQMEPTNWRRLEQPCPDLCADRIDYNLQGAYFQNFITKQEALDFVDDLQFIDRIWIVSKKDLTLKIARSCLYLTEHCWGGATNYITSRALAEAMLKGVDNGLFTFHDIHFGIDQQIWDLLDNTPDPFIQKQLAVVKSPTSYYNLVDAKQANLVVKSKFRGINPWIRSDGGCKRLTELDPLFAEEYNNLKNTLQRGWMIRCASVNCDN